MRRGGAVLMLAVMLPGGVVALTNGINHGADATNAAERGEQIQVTPTTPPATCNRVVVVGDSLMDNAEPWLRVGLKEAGFTYEVDAQPSRRIPATVRSPYSGVTAARSIRATWGEADCWLVSLGSNDLIFGADDPATADAMIAEMTAALTPGALVWWMNVDYHRDPDIRFDFVAATATFNDRLDARALTDPRFTVIDWYSLAEANLGWFFDPVHVDRTGSIVRAQQAVAALPPPG